MDLTNVYPQKYTGPLANIRYGNEIAQRSVDSIRSRFPRDRHAHLFLAEARRLSESHWVTATRPVPGPLGPVLLKDYAEQLKQAAFAMTLMHVDETARAA